MRAYIGIGALHLDPSEPNTIILPFENNGATPANNVRAEGDWYFVPSDHDIEENFDFRSYSNGGRVSVTALSPSQKKEVLLKLPFNLLDDVVNKKIKLLYYGFVQYEDLYGDVHKSEFAYEVMPLPSGDPHGTAWLVYHKHNSMN